METKANHILIGAFVLLMSFTGAGFMYWIADWGTSTRGKYYNILFEGDVSGLTSASSVLFNGLKVGTVRKLDIYRKDTRKVRVFIQVHPDVPIRENSRARIASQALTGFAAIQLTAGTPDAKILPARTEAPFPLIKADAATSRSLTQAVPEALGNANALLTRLNDLVANNEDAVRNSLRSVESTTSDVSDIVGENKTSITNTIKSLETFTAMLEQNSEDIGEVIKNAKALSARFNTIADKLETAVDGFNSYISADSSSIISQAKEAITYFRDLAKKLDDTLGEGAGEVMALAKKSLREVEPFMQDAKRAFKSVERVMTELERNPSSLIYGKGNQSSYASGQ